MKRSYSAVRSESFSAGSLSQRRKETFGEIEPEVPAEVFEAHRLKADQLDLVLFGEDLRHRRRVAFTAAERTPVTVVDSDPHGPRFARLDS